MSNRSFARIACAALVSGALGLFASAALADFPVPPNVTMSATRINLVGFDPAKSGNQADFLAPGAEFTIVAKYATGDPIVNAPVYLDFSACPDVRIAPAQSFEGVTANCSWQTAQSSTDASGTVHFAVIGARVPGPAHGANTVRVIIDAYVIGFISVGTYDENGSGGVSLADLGMWVDDYFGLQNPDRSDFDGNGMVTLADLAMFAKVYFGNGSTASGSLCP